MQSIYPSEGKIRMEDYVQPSHKESEIVGESYAGFYKSRNERSGKLRQFQYHTFTDYLTVSRELFWNSMVTKSDDLEELGLDFSLPFIRKEVMDFVGRLTSQGISPKLTGEGAGIHGVNVLQAIYKKWRLKSNDKVEKFWQTLYSVTNGTVCLNVGFDGAERDVRYLEAYDPETKAYKIREEKRKPWNDVFSEIIPIEEIYLSKLWERDIQKQGRVWRLQEMAYSDFQREFGSYDRASLVLPGNRIAEDSLYFTLLGGSGITTSDKVQILRDMNTDGDKFPVMANGVMINPLGDGENVACPPNPHHHKMMPLVWSINEAIDEKFAYGLSTPFKLKDPHKILNTSFTMMVERELRAIDPPIITSDFEAPQLIFGQKRIVPVNDINAYKEFKIGETSNQFFTMQNSLQGMMSSFGQGGFSQIIPSRQPKSAREVMAMDSMKQQSLGNALLTYYDLVRQELFLVLKTALQFYQTGKYDTGAILRSITVPNFPLTTGGIGNMEVRIVKEPKMGLALYFESIKRSVETGKATEIMEVPTSVLDNLAFYIDEIKLEPEKSSEMERAVWNEQVLQPLLNVFIPAGVADMGKTYLRFLEKNSEHPSDFSKDETVTQLGYGGGKPFQMPQGRQGAGAMTGNMNQSMTGTMFGSQSNGGIPSEEYGA